MLLQVSLPQEKLDVLQLMLQQSQDKDASRMQLPWNF